MPHAHDVQPQKWSDLQVLYDDGHSSVIFGRYNSTPTLGMRWNGDGDAQGFPSQGSHPVWHVVPGFLHEHILDGVVQELFFRYESNGEDIEEGLLACNRASETLVKTPHSQRVLDAILAKNRGPESLRS